jgi:hypothetical protein
MAIRTKQIGRLANSVINRFLQAGTLPAVRAVIGGVYAALGGRISGNPLTQVTPVVPQAQTDPLALGVLSQTIGGDIGDLYNEDIDQVNRIIRNFDYKQTRRERLTQRMVALNAELQQLPLRGQQLHSTIDSFNRIDFDRTDAHVNFRDYCVELPPLSNRTTKLDLRAATVAYHVDGAVKLTLGTPSSMVDDLANSAFFVRTAAAGPVTMTITLTLPAPAALSQLSIMLEAGTEVQATATLDSQTLSTQQLGLSRRAVWNVAERTVSRIVITLTKTLPDAPGLFDFGVRNISLQSEQFAPSATLTSQRLRFAAPLAGVTLSAEAEIPPNTSISWSLSRTGPDGLFFEVPLETPLRFGPPVVRDAKYVLPVRQPHGPAKVFNADGGAADGGLAVQATIRGSRTPLFALCRVDPAVMFGQSVVARGRDAWRVSAYHYDTNYAGVVADPTPSLADFIDLRGGTPTVYTRFQPREDVLTTQYPGLGAELAAALRLPAIEYPLQSATDRVMHRFEATLTVDPSLAPPVLGELAATTVSLPMIFGSNRAALYLNGTRIAVAASVIAGSLQYAAVLPLQPGANNLQIVTNNYVALAGAAFDIGTTTFSGMIASGWLQWSAEAGPMTEVSLFELQYQTARNDFSRYALTEDPNSAQQLLVIRELPTTRYDITTTGPASGPQDLVLQARLNGSSVQPALTPKIFSYTLTESV